MMYVLRFLGCMTVGGGVECSVCFCEIQSWIGEKRTNFGNLRLRRRVCGAAAVPQARPGSSLNTSCRPCAFLDHRDCQSVSVSIVIFQRLIVE
ncbi:hypothetical protein OBBRIDRAFT_399527 [Obba rivulosa]|uniref:Secreted protein n=1 Tax=Obba rivulosa TaxID=1052685 RepID=A0A8E2DE67_9APHY|nr:hypothetical protein OBBRIDRAFT_399527 [Obba rivulosa]